MIQTKRYEYEQLRAIHFPEITLDDHELSQQIFILMRPIRKVGNKISWYVIARCGLSSWTVAYNPIVDGGAR